MNIEEQIKIVKNMLLHAETQLLDYEAIAIETLLTAYEKEKEKNKELEEVIDEYKQVSKSAENKIDDLIKTISSRLEE